MKYHYFLPLLLLLVVSCSANDNSNTPLPETSIFAIYYAQGSGNSSYCDKAESYTDRCIAETELEMKLPVQYNCCFSSDCLKPSCVTFIGCGSGNSKDTGGCPIQEYCRVNPIWLCEETGGVASENDSEGFIPDNFCTCPNGEMYIENFGCADCDSFENEETRSYCKQERNETHFGNTYFKKYCDSEWPAIQ